MPHNRNGQVDGKTQLPEPNQNSGNMRHRPINRPPIRPQNAPWRGQVGGGSNQVVSTWMIYYDDAHHRTCSLTLLTNTARKKTEAMGGAR